MGGDAHEPLQPVRERPIPEATVGRLPVYLRVLLEMAEAGKITVSSETLAEAAGVNSAKVRKDLSHLGSYGTRGVGYDVAYLIHQVRRELGLTQHWPVVIAGIGNLGHALANYRGFSERGFQAVALVDSDPGKVGERAGGLRIRHIDDLPEIVREQEIAIGVVCTPAGAAQEVADRMVEAGIRSILNFAPAIISVPAGVSLRKVDLSIELQILAFYEQRKAILSEVRRGRRTAAPSSEANGAAGTSATDSGELGLARAGS
jgi:redox-sensing transcriptional repressor